jgi:hypothetical protein
MAPGSNAQQWQCPLPWDSHPLLGPIAHLHLFLYILSLPSQHPFLDWLPAVLQPSPRGADLPRQSYPNCLYLWPQTQQIVLLCDLVKNAPHAGGNHALLCAAGVSSVSPPGSDIVGREFLTNFNDH